MGRIRFLFSVLKGFSLLCQAQKRCVICDGIDNRLLRDLSCGETASALKATAVQAMAVSCFGGSNGSATVTPIGGTPEYTITPIQTLLTEGLKTITVTDANLHTTTGNFSITQLVGVNLDLKVFLEGNYISASTSMTTWLNDFRLLPGQNPALSSNPAAQFLCLDSDLIFRHRRGDHSLNADVNAADRTLWIPNSGFFNLIPF